MHMRTFKIISFYILIAIPQFLFFIPYIVLADEWILESQIAKDTWGMEEQSPKYEWGLEDLTSKHEKAIALYSTMMVRHGTVFTTVTACGSMVSMDSGLRISLLLVIKALYFITMATHGLNRRAM